MSLLLRKPPAPPQLDPLPNLLPRHAIRDQFHRQPQPLRLPIPRLVVEKQHIFKSDPRPLLQGLKVLDLAPGVYLQPTIKHIDRNLLLSRRLLVTAVILCKRRRRWDVDSLEQFAGQGRGAGARCNAQLDLVGVVEIWQNGEDLGHFAVKLEFLARAVCCAGMRRVDL